MLAFGSIGGGHWRVDSRRPGAVQELVCSHTLTARPSSDNTRSVFVFVFVLCVVFVFVFVSDTQTHDMFAFNTFSMSLVNHFVWSIIVDFNH